jgi:putative transposase
MMIYNRKIPLIVTEEQAYQLDGQSKICNWLYNQLLELCRWDYYENHNHLKLLHGRNLRNQVPKFKQQHPFLKVVHSSPLKNVALRLKDAYDRAFEQGNHFPKFRSWKRKWFSLLYDEPNKGFKVNGKALKLTFGVDKDNKRKSIVVQLKQPLEKGVSIKNLRITKERDQFYAVFCLEKEEREKHEPLTWIALDPNHKNLATAVDDEGRTYEFGRLHTITYWDKTIDRLKSKRDRCQRKAKFIELGENRGYFRPSKRWERLNQALNRAYDRRREQMKQGLYSLAHHLAKRYDVVVIGNYVPTKEVSPYGCMHRSMLNQTPIGQLRRILEWVFTKSRKHYQKVDERNTTKICCVCGHKEKKSPNVRVFTCVKCGHTLGRDLNSAVNIARKVHLLPRSGYIGAEPMYIVSWNRQTHQWVISENKGMKSTS